MGTGRATQGCGQNPGFALRRAQDRGGTSRDWTCLLEGAFKGRGPRPQTEGVGPGDPGARRSQNQDGALWRRRRALVPERFWRLKWNIHGGGWQEAGRARRPRGYGRWRRPRCWFKEQGEGGESEPPPPPQESSLGGSGPARCGLEPSESTSLSSPAPLRTIWLAGALLISTFLIFSLPLILLLYIFGHICQ